MVEACVQWRGLVLSVFNLRVRLPCADHFHMFILERYNYLDYKASNCRITDDGSIGKDFKGISHGPVEILFLHLSRGVVESLYRVS
jgi:hypothetical protein